MPKPERKNGKNIRIFPEKGPQNGRRRTGVYEFSPGETQYLKNVLGKELLKNEEEKDLGRAILKKNPEAVNEMILRNLRLPIKMAHHLRRKTGTNVMSGELIGDANFALVKYTPEYNYRRGKFSTYITWKIFGELSKTIAREHAITPVNVTAAAIFRKIHNLETELGHEPTPEQIVERLGMKPLLAKRWLKFYIQNQVTSLDSLVRTSPDGLIETLGELLPDQNAPDPQEEVLEHEKQETIRKVFARRLSVRERKVLESRYGLAGNEKLTLEETGKRLGFTKEGIRQIEKRALQKIKTDLADIRPGDDHNGKSPDK